jgi:hypothetical protein
MQSKANWLIKERDEVNDMLEKMEDYYKNEWEWPGDKAAWIRETVSSDLNDAIRSGVQILSTVEPRVRIQPLGKDEGSKQVANRMEKVLLWHLQNASRRPRAPIVENVVFSSLLYSMVAAQVIYLPWQIKIFKEQGKDTSHLERALKYYGPYSIIVRNPRSVYPLWTDYMLEEVLFAEVWEYNKLKAFYGEKAVKGLERDNPLTEVVVYDYMDLKNRFIWARPGSSTTPSTEAESSTVVIYDGEHGLDFIPWVVKSHGPSPFFPGEEDSLDPLLYAVYKSGHWDTQNIVATILVSEMITYGAAPRRVTKTPDGRGVDVKYGEPGGSVDLIAGLEDYEPLSPPPIDRGLSEILDRLSAWIGKSTVARMIQNPEVHKDVPYSAMNLIFQLGANSLQPYKKLAEDTLAEIFAHMLYWLDQSGDTLAAYIKEKRSDDYGDQLFISPGDFDVSNLYIDVTLTADVPTDRVARTNNAIMMNRELRYPLERSLEDLGVNDPQTAIDEWENEQRRLTELQIELQERQAEAQMLMGQKVQVMQQMAQAVQSGQQPQQPAFEGVEGPGFNPAEGGTPPAQAAPELIREVLAGQTQGGEGLAGL